MSGTSAVRETVCLCKQLSFIDLRCTVSQAERWFGSVCVALQCLCWRWDKVHVKTMQEDLECINHISVHQPQMRQRSLTSESITHVSTVCFPGLSVSEEAPHHRVTTGSLTDHQRAHSLQPPSTPVLPRRFLPPQSRNSPRGQSESMVYEQLRIIDQLHSEIVHGWIVEQIDNFKNISVHVTPTGAHAHALWGLLKAILGNGRCH